MKNRSRSLSPLVILLTTALLARAGFAQEAANAASEGGKPKFAGTYLSATGMMPPLPYHPYPDLPTIAVGENQFTYDDSKVDYAAIRAESAQLAAENSSLKESEAGGASHGPALMNMNECLRLLPPEFDGGSTILKIEGAEEGAQYDVFACTNLTEPLQWQFVVRGAPGQTNLAFIFATAGVALFQLGTMQDSDGDTLTDAFEALVTQTGPHTANTLATAGTNAILVTALTPHPPVLESRSYDYELWIDPTYTVCENPSYRQVTVDLHWTNGVGGSLFEHNRYGYCNPGTQVITYSNIYSLTLWDATNGACLQRREENGDWSECISAEYVTPAPVNFVKFYRRTTNDVTWEGVVNHQEFKITSLLRMRTEGEQFSTKLRLYNLHVTASVLNDYGVPVAAVPPEHIQVLGKTLNSNGLAWFVWADHITNDFAPVLPPQYTNYEFHVSFARTDLKLYLNEVPRTDKEVTVEAGQQIHLACVLDPPIATITNYQWTVPNEPISNWVHTVTLGEVVDLPLWAYTNADLYLYWWKRATNFTVQCSVKVEGEAMIAKTTVTVRKPFATITALILNQVKVDSNWDNGQRTALHFGDASLPRGIKFTRTSPAITEWAWLQIINTVRRQRNGTTGQWKRIQGMGLDTAFPYPQEEVQNSVTDSPGNQFFDETDEATIQEGFDMYLMYKPNGNDCIWVPVSKIGWSWSGRALTGTNGWTLDSTWPAPQISTNGASEPAQFPGWDDNFIQFKDNWQTE